VPGGEGFPGLEDEDEEPLQIAEKSFFGNAVPETRNPKVRFVQFGLARTF